MILENIRTLCKERRISISALEKATNIGNGTISGWNTCSPRVNNLQAVAQYFGITVDELLREDGTAAEKEVI